MHAWQETYRMRAVFKILVNTFLSRAKSRSGKEFNVFPLGGEPTLPLKTSTDSLKFPS